MVDITFVRAQSQVSTGDRIHYLEEWIVRQNFNRYAYEGVIEHQKIRKKVEKLLGNYQKSKKDD